MLRKNGILYSFGKNGGQIGVGNTENEVFPIALSYQNYNIIKVCAGDEHTIILQGSTFIIF